MKKILILLVATLLTSTIYAYDSTDEMIDQAKENYCKSQARSAAGTMKLRQLNANKSEVLAALKKAYDEKQIGQEKYKWEVNVVYHAWAKPLGKTDDERKTYYNEFGDLYYYTCIGK